MCSCNWTPNEVATGLEIRQSEIGSLVAVVLLQKLDNTSMIESILKGVREFDELWNLHDRFLKLVQEYPAIGTMLIVLVITGLLYTAYKTVASFANDLMRWLSAPRTAIGLFCGAAAVTVFSAFLTHLILYYNEPAPAFTHHNKTPFVAEAAYLKWTYKPNETADQFLYQIEGADDAEFLSNKRVEAYTDVPFYPVVDFLNGVRHYHVRAVQFETKKPLSRWSEATRLEQYASAASRIRKTGIVTVFVSQSYDQGIFKFVKDGLYNGFDIKLMKAIVERLPRQLGMDETSSLKVQIRSVKWDELLNSPSEGRADVIISSITSLQERVESNHIHFTEPYYCTTQSLVYRGKKSFHEIKSALKSKTIGVQKGTTSELLLHALRTEAGGDSAFNITLFPEASGMLESLLSSASQIDFGFTDTPFAIAAALRNNTEESSPVQYLPLSAKDVPQKVEPVEKYAIAVRFGEAKLLSAINTVLAELRRNGTADNLFKASVQEFAGTWTDDLAANHSLPSECS
jgi:ABC-type amino acid transport substrate-binding protein